MALLDDGSWDGRIFNGSWVESSGGATPIREPATGDEIGSYGLANIDDLTAATNRAAAAQRDWAAASFEERAAVLRRAGELFESDRRAAHVDHA